MGGCCGRCCDAIVRRSFRPDEPDEERARKQVTIPSFMIAGGFLGFCLIAGPALSAPDALAAGLLVGFLSASAGIAYPLVTKRYPLHLMGGVLSWGVLAIVLCDWKDGAQLNVARALPWLIMVMDSALVVGLSERWQSAYIACAVLWNAVLGLEGGWRVGLFDIPGWTEAGPPPACDCSEPPCAMGGVGGVTVFFNFTAIFLIDFGLTRGFANEMREQQAAMDAAIDMSGQVAVLLAAYQTEQARQIVDQEADSIPLELCEAYTQLLDNLESYKPYLPQSCLPDSFGDAEATFNDDVPVISASANDNGFTERPSAFTEERSGRQDTGECVLLSPALSPKVRGALAVTPLSPGATPGDVHMLSPKVYDWQCDQPFATTSRECTGNLTATRNEDASRSGHSRGNLRSPTPTGPRLRLPSILSGTSAGTGAPDSELPRQDSSAGLGARAQSGPIRTQRTVNATGSGSFHLGRTTSAFLGERTKSSVFLMGGRKRTKSRRKRPSCVSVNSSPAASLATLQSRPASVLSQRERGVLSPAQTPQPPAAPTGRGPTRAGSADGLGRKPVTLAAVNVTGYLRLARDASAAQLAEFHSVLLAALMRRAQARRGLTDGISADRFHASLNGARPAPGHRAAGVRLAWEAAGASGGCVDLAALLASAGVGARGGDDVRLAAGACSGEARCGDVGCPGLRRYSFIGDAAAWVHACERLASRWPARAVVNGRAREEAVVAYSSRLRAAAAMAKPGHAGLDPQWLWEVVAPRRDMPADEWMYQLARQESGDVWQHLNAAMVEFYGGRHGAALSHIVEGRAALPGAPSPGRAADEGVGELPALYAALESHARTRPDKPLATYDDAGCGPLPSRAAAW